jgi:hypothetical protein
MGISTQGVALDQLLKLSAGLHLRDFQIKLKETRDWSSTRVDENYRAMVSSAPLLPRWIDVSSVLEQKMLLSALGLPCDSLRLPAPERVYHLFAIGVSQTIFYFPNMALERHDQFTEVIKWQWKHAVFQAVSAGHLSGQIPLLGGSPPTPKPRPQPAVPPPRLDFEQGLPPPTLQEEEEEEEEEGAPTEPIVFTFPEPTPAPPTTATAEKEETTQDRGGDEDDDDDHAAPSEALTIEYV